MFDLLLPPIFSTQKNLSDLDLISLSPTHKITHAHLIDCSPPIGSRRVAHAPRHILRYIAYIDTTHLYIYMYLNVCVYPQYIYAQATKCDEEIIEMK